MDNNEFIRPPGSYYDVLPHPSGTDKTTEIAIVQEHRFAFYYWSKWRNKVMSKRKNEKFVPPPLLTFDWHEDLAEPGENERADLKDIDLDDYRALAYFCWDGLNTNNDGHILSAVYLNLLGDIYVVCKQEINSNDTFNDIDGNAHQIHCYHSIDKLYDDLKSKDYPSIYFDIDLDYFTESEDPCGGGEKLVIVDDDEIKSALDPDSDHIKWILERLDGMTIATEPEFCGGMSNSNRIYSIIDSVLFSQPLLSGTSNWIHMAK